VCETSLIDLSYPGSWEYYPGYMLHGGIGHASLNLVDSFPTDEWSTYSELDDNRNRQALIFALWDLCMGGDPQWLHQLKREYSIWSFDHGFWLAGEANLSIDGLRRIGDRPWLYDLDVSVASATGLLAAADRVQGLTSASIRAVTEGVPLEWGVTSEGLSAIADILYVRAESVAERLRSAADQSEHT
jgi:hypothetical protein